MKITRIIAFTNKDAFEIWITDDKAEGKYLLEFNEGIGRDQHKLTFEVAKWMHKKKGNKRKISGKVLTRLMGYEKFEHDNLVFAPWDECRREKRTTDIGIFRIYKIEKNTLQDNIIDKDFRHSLGKDLFKVLGRKYENSLFWLYDEDVEIQVIKQRRPYFRREKTVKTITTSKFIKVPIFTEESNKYVKFALKTENLNQDVLTSANGFHITLPESKKKYLQYYNNKRPEFEKFKKLLNEGENILVIGIPDVGKTRLVYEGLKCKDIQGYYIFSLQQISFLMINAINISENFNPKDKKVIWFIDDISYSFGTKDVLWRMYEKLINHFGSIIVIATVRKDKELVDKSQLIKYMKKLDVLPWKLKEAKGFVKKHKIPFSEAELEKRFTGTLFSIYGDIDKLKDIYDEKVEVKCKWMLRYLKLLHDFLQKIDRNLLEDVYAYLANQLYTKEKFEICLNNLRCSGFIELSGSIVSSWDLCFKEIITEEDYPKLELDLSKLIGLFSTNNYFILLSILCDSYSSKKDYGNSIKCANQLLGIAKNSETYSHLITLVYLELGRFHFFYAEEAINTNLGEDIFKSRISHALSFTEKAATNGDSFAEAYYNWGNILAFLANINQSKEDFLKACQKFESAIKFNNRYAEAYYDYGFSLLNLSKLEDNDMQYLAFACENFEKAVNCKNDYAYAYFSWGSALMQIAYFNKDRKQFEDAQEKFYLANLHDKYYYIAYYAFGMSFLHLFNLFPNEYDLLINAREKFKQANEYNKMFKATHNVSDAYMIIFDMPSNADIHNRLGECLLYLAKIRNCDTQLLKDACNEFSIALNDKPLFIDAIVNCSAANLFLWHLENNAEEYYHQCCYMIELSLAESGQKETCVMLIKALCNNLDINKVTNLSRTSCVVLFELFLTNIMRNKLQSLGLLKDCICYIESMLGERLVSFFAHLFSKAVDVIYFSSKISKQDYTSLVNSKGISSESDIVIEALIEKKPPENEFEQNDLISKTAYFLANEIVKYWGKV